MLILTVWTIKILLLIVLFWWRWKVIFCLILYSYAVWMLYCILERHFFCDSVRRKSLPLCYSLYLMDTFCGPTQQPFAFISFVCNILHTNNSATITFLDNIINSFLFPLLTWILASDQLVGVFKRGHWALVLYNTLLRSLHTFTAQVQNCALELASSIRFTEANECV
jgi:hypothetical protein